MEDKDFETLEDLDINDENTKEEETSEDVNVIKEQKIDDIPKEILDKITKYGFEFSFGANSRRKPISGML